MSESVDDILAEADALWERLYDAELGAGRSEVAANDRATWARIAYLAAAGPEVVTEAERRWRLQEQERLKRSADYRLRLSRLGIPFTSPTMPVGPLPLDAFYGQQWRGYTLEGFGVVMDHEPSFPDDWWPHWIVDEPDPATSRTKFGPRFLQAYREATRKAWQIIVQLWEQVLRAPDTPVFLEVLWHPEHGRTVALRVDRAGKLADITRAHRLVPLAARMTGRVAGRKPGTHDFRTVEELDAAIAAAIARIKEQTRKRAMRFSYARVAAEIPTATSTLKDAVRRLGSKWRPGVH